MGPGLRRHDELLELKLPHFLIVPENVRAAHQRDIAASMSPPCRIVLLPLMQGARH
jgi:hypothetical protein